MQKLHVFKVVGVRELHILKLFNMQKLHKVLKDGGISGKIKLNDRL